MTSPRRSVARTRRACARWAAPRLRGLAALGVGQPAPQRRVLDEVAPVAADLAGELVGGLLDPAQPAGQPDHAPVGLELGEARLEEGGGALAARPAGQVDGHVVGRAEARVERVGSGAREPGDRARVEARLPEHHRVPLDVDAASARAAGELGVLPRGERDVGLAVPLVELLEHDRAGGHVDAEREGLGREDGPDQALGEQLLDDLLEDREHARVVGGDAASQREHPVVVAEDGEVLVGDVAGPPGGDGLDLLRLGGRGQPQARLQALLDGGVAAGPAEDERDRGEQPGRVEPVDDLRAVRRRVALGPVAAAAGAAGGLADLLAPGQPHQFRVDLTVVIVDEQVVEAAAGQHVLPQRHRPVLVDDDLGAAADLGEPVAELLGVGDRGRQRDHPNGLGEVDDHLFPDRAAGPVGQVVHLVEDDVAEVPERGRAGVEHVPQHLGGHHHDRGAAVDGVVAGEQAHRVAVVALDEVVVLLVRQRLDRRGVEALAALLERQVDRVLAHDGLARSRRRRHQHPVPAGEGGAGGDLERVEVEAVEVAERSELWGGLPLAEPRVAFGRAHRGAHGSSVWDFGPA